MASSPPAPPLPPSPLPGGNGPDAAPRPRWPGRLAWAALALELGAAGALAMTACGLSWFGGWPILDFCPAPAAADPRHGLIGREQARERDLEQRWNQLRLALADAPSCRSEPPIQVAERPPADTPPERVRPGAVGVPVGPAERVVPGGRYLPGGEAGPGTVDRPVLPGIAAPGRELVPGDRVPGGTAIDDRAPDQVPPEGSVPTEPPGPEATAPDAPGPDTAAADPAGPEDNAPDATPDRNAPDLPATPPEPPRPDLDQPDIDQPAPGQTDADRPDTDQPAPDRPDANPSDRTPPEPPRPDLAPADTPQAPRPGRQPPAPADQRPPGTNPPDTNPPQATPGDRRPGDTDPANPTAPVPRHNPVPERNWRDRDVSFLQGCWRLASDYRITRRDTGEVFATRNWQMCFDGQGNGTQTLVFDNGLRCEGPVQAAFTPGGSLAITDTGDVPCSNGSTIDRRITECRRLPDGTADCTTQHTRPPRYPLPVRFQRQG